MTKKTTNPVHEHPHTSIQVRVSKESSFAAPGLDTPAETQRPKRDVGTPQDHPVNRPIADEDKSLIGPQLGRGGTEKPMQVFAVPEPSVPAVDEHAEHFDVTSVIGHTKGSN
jgi:hypothetical protein